MAKTAEKNVAAAPTKSSIMPMSLVLVPLVLGFAINHYFGEHLPVAKTLVRNVFLGPVPEKLAPVHATCSAQYLAERVTIVASVKDSCSQAPGFLKGLEKIAPPSVHLIYTFPNFSSCAEIDLTYQYSYWNKHDEIPLSPHVAPMQGWLDAMPLVKTPFTYLIHNDGYALDDYFLCELVRGLEDKKKKSSDYAVAAPMLYENKGDGSFAAHATQSNLRVSNEGGKHILRHDHSLKMALRRQGSDLVEEEQENFLEDHGFLIDSEKVSSVIDPHASFTMEYLDMIMSIKSNNWKVLLVPTARLEFRVTEFSWRDIPYFMYKRSEITAQTTRDYLSAKWQVQFPNTGFWTFIKYTILEQHVYSMEDLADVSWKHQSLLAFGFFEMVGWNRYVLEEGGDEMTFLNVMDVIESGWTPAGAVASSRETKRKVWDKTNVKPTKKYARDILPITEPEVFNIEADLTLEYFPFAAAEFRLKGQSCDALKDTPLLSVCGLVVQHENDCSCWINLPTFKNNGVLPKVIDTVAGWIKIPSRISTFFEMTQMDPDVIKHTKRLERFQQDTNEWSFRLLRCDQNDAVCAGSFEFTKQSSVVQFLGLPYSPVQVAAALDSYLKKK